MGHMHAQEMAASGVELDVALQWHLQSNHVPPVHEDFIPAAKEAITQAVAALESEEEVLWYQPIELPNGKLLTVAEVVEGLHLQAFVEVELDRNDTALDAEGDN